MTPEAIVVVIFVVGIILGMFFLWAIQQDQKDFELSRHTEEILNRYRR